MQDPSYATLYRRHLLAGKHGDKVGAKRMEYLNMKNLCKNK